MKRITQSVLLTIVSLTLVQFACTPEKNCSAPFGITALAPGSAASQTIQVKWNAEASKAEVELFDMTTNVSVDKRTGTSPMVFTADPTHSYEARVKALCDDGGESEVVKQTLVPKYQISIDATPKTLADSALFCPFIINADSFSYVQDVQENFYEWLDEDELIILSAGTNQTFSTFFILKRTGNATTGSTTPAQVIFLDHNISGTIFCDNKPATFPFSFGTEGIAVVNQSTITITNPNTNVNLRLELHPRGYSVIGTGQTQRINLTRRRG